MPKRTDIESILIIGAGPIVIGQACEFDYSGTQACKALKEEGYRLILANSNPATIMTDPGLADATYVEPVTPETLARIIERERPDALLPTMGGQTALNTAMALEKNGVLKKFGVEMIAASSEVIDKAEDRQKFRLAMEGIGLECPRARIVNTVVEAGEASPASTTVFTIRARGHSSPMPSIARRNFCRSSALSMTSLLAAIISTPNFLRTPFFSNAMAVFNAVWPPIVGNSASGRSRSMIRARVSGVTGST